MPLSLFICIYPAYLNNKKTIAEGRRIPISKAVENPTATEIQDVCSAVGLNAFLEKNKMYSREWNRDVQYRGRVRVQLKQEDGSLCLVQFPSRKSVMLYVAEMIPKLKTRTQKTGGADPSLQQGEGSKKGKGKKKKWCGVNVTHTVLLRETWASLCRREQLLCLSFNWTEQCVSRLHQQLTVR